MLENEYIKLRAVEPSDLELLYEWENATDIWGESDTITPFSRFALGQYIETSRMDIFEAKQLRLMIDARTENNVMVPIGSVDLFDYNPQHQRAGVGILIYDRSYRQKGYAKQALKLFVAYAFGTLGLHQLYCNIAMGNEASIRLFKKLNFEVVGVKKDWRKTSNGWNDEYLMQRLC
jgi:diamine N-acetyltransferase